MKKIYILDGNENWICDRFTREWRTNNPELCAKNPMEADILWLLAEWKWDSIPPSILDEKKVVVTIHHIVPEKFHKEKAFGFSFRDKFVDLYHVPCYKTMMALRPLTSKPIEIAPFWVNSDIFFEIENKQTLREKYNIAVDKFVIGSFQRDTEGHDLKSPKLEKGPDIFCDVVEHLHSKNKNIQVLLAGWRRQYVINRLETAGIKYYYYEFCDFETLNELYNCLDLYIVSSRCEGGPQAIVECGITKTPIISTDVGLASRFLPHESIADSDKLLFAEPNVEQTYKNVVEYEIGKYMKKFNNLIINSEKLL